MHSNVLSNTDHIPDPGVSCVIPDSPRIVAIEFPGYVRNVDRATRMLGGVEGIAAAMNTAGSNPGQGGGLMRVSFRPDDPTCHPLIGRQRPVAGLLLRISRKRPDACVDGAGGPVPAPHAGEEDGQRRVAAEVVASVSTSFRFNGLADFQYLPHDPAAKLRNQFVDLGDGSAVLPVPEENLAGRAGECVEAVEDHRNCVWNLSRRRAVCRIHV